MSHPQHDHQPESSLSSSSSTPQSSFHSLNQTSTTETTSSCHPCFGTKLIKSSLNTALNNSKPHQKYCQQHLTLLALCCLLKKKLSGQRKKEDLKERSMLHQEEKVHEVLDQVHNRKNGDSAISIPRFLPPKMKELLAELAMVEGEIGRLEGQISQLQLGLKHEQEATKESKLSNQWHTETYPIHRSVNNESQRMGYHETKALHFISKAIKGDYDHLNDLKLPPKSVPIPTQLEENSQNWQPNKLSEEIMKCLNFIYIRLLRATRTMEIEKSGPISSFRDDTGANAKSSLLLQKESRQQDPYGIFNVKDSTTHLGRNLHQSSSCQGENAFEIFPLPSPTTNEWKKAMKEELKALDDNKTSSVIKLPPGKKVVGRMFLNQRKHILDLLQEADIMDYKPASTPLDCKHKMTMDGETLTDISYYQRLVGKLIYLTITRPDIAFDVRLMSQFMHSLTMDHLQVVKRILRYLKGSVGRGLLMQNNAYTHILAFDFNFRFLMDLGTLVNCL
ncbi:hypothetical protein D8674_006399 [Pyrus ussuriensis x Pyrus communis]|uniref:Ternary complex factor MIP1 leucine-zipper domain-containing protein n=1 Tax=Pyrus ussuriensis x Pyrus communis TaxID=2448454 RepID=A0A5N5FZV4_9ROSA|nr:hypothetical protein D8674_006399 [Pyrus ussuriensis x Pyrus communis]